MALFLLAVVVCCWLLGLLFVVGCWPFGWLLGYWIACSGVFFSLCRVFLRGLGPGYWLLVGSVFDCFGLFEESAAALEATLGRLGPLLAALGGT